MSRISDIEGKEFKLWCPVHSSGQGYITCHYEIEKDHFELFSSGTDEDAQGSTIFSLDLHVFFYKKVVYEKVLLDC